jgi:phosphohistidine phosphatase SixA
MPSPDKSGEIMTVPWSGIRKIMPVTVGLVLLSGPGALFAGQLVGDGQPKLTGTALAKELQKGGFVIYFRHGATNDVGEKEVAGVDLKNCQLQSNLSDEGRAQTRKIGEAFRQLRIPVGKVYSSPYCRCLETARNIFGKAEKSPALHFAIHLKGAERTNVTSQLLDLLGTPPQPGTNTGMVSHSANLQEAVGIWPKPEGVAHVFKPSENGQFSYVGLMLPEAWPQEASRIARQGWQFTPPHWFGSAH